MPLSLSLTELLREPANYEYIQTLYKSVGDLAK